MKKFLALSCLFAPVLSTAQIIYSNNLAPGDLFTNTGTTVKGQAIGSSDWFYNNVRNKGEVGIRNNHARSGNGSVYFNLTQTGTSSSKADIEFLGQSTTDSNGNFYATSPLGTLGNLTSLSYDWLRESGGTAEKWLMPTIRIGVASADASQFGYLVFEQKIQDNSYVAATDNWVSEDIVSGNYRLWSSGNTLPFNLDGTNGAVKYYDALTLSDWKTNYGSLLVTSINVGVGSGWGTFSGAVDNVSFGFGGQNRTFNFEVASAPVPEPFTMTLGLAGAALAIRRRRKALRK